MHQKFQHRNNFTFRKLPERRKLVIFKAKFTQKYGHCQLARIQGVAGKQIINTHEGRYVIPLMTPQTDDIPIGIALELYTKEGLQVFQQSIQNNALLPTKPSGKLEYYSSAIHQDVKQFDSDESKSDVDKGIFIARYVLDGLIENHSQVSRDIRYGDTMVQLSKPLNQMKESNLPANVEGLQMMLDESCANNATSDQKAQHHSKQQFQQRVMSLEQAASKVTRKEHLDIDKDIQLASLLMILPPDAAPFFNQQFGKMQQLVAQWCSRLWQGPIVGHVTPRDISSMMAVASRYASVAIKQQQQQEKLQQHIRFSQAAYRHALNAPHTLAPRGRHTKATSNKAATSNRSRLLVKSPRQRLRVQWRRQLSRMSVGHAELRHRLVRSTSLKFNRLMRSLGLPARLRPGLLLHSRLENSQTFRLPQQTNRVVLLIDPLDALWPFILGVEIFEPGHITPRHVHNHAYEMFFILSGRGVAWCDGKQTPVEQGQVLVFPPGSRHAVDVSLDGPLYCVELMLPNEMFAEFVKQGELRRLDPRDMCVLANLGCGGGEPVVP